MFETPEIASSTAAGRPRGGPAEVLSIQILRFVAAFAVVIFHSQQALSKGAYETLGYWFELGAAGVHVFFVISGFVIMHTSFAGTDVGMPTKRFLLRRFTRIFPIYWLCCAAYVAYHQTFGTSYDLSLTDWLGALLLLPSGSSKIIGPGWTLSYELYFYICFAALLRLSARMTLIALTMFFVGSIIVGLLINFRGPTAIITNPLILEFCAGCWLGYFYARRNVGSRGVGISLVISGIILFVAGALVDYRTVPLSVIWGIPSILLVAGCLIAERAGPLPKWARQASHLGDSSYVLYLIHILCITIALDLGLNALVPMEPAAGVGAAVLLSIACAAAAAAIFHFLERPMLRWLRRNVVDRFSSPRRPAPPAREALNP
jgi:exopolysaccharide production protein ExoZ